MTEKPYSIKERSFEFAKRILDVVELLPHKPQCEIINTQLVKSGTSIGANIEEADGTITKKDFVNKMTIARKEAKETSYWLRLIIEKYIKSEELISDLKECYELTSIISSIINKSRL